MYWLVAFFSAITTIALVLIWQSFRTARRGISEAAGAVKEVIGTVRPVTEGLGHIAYGVGEGVHAIVDRLRNKQAELFKLASDNASMRAQIEQLKARRVTATAVERQLQVAFFSISTKYTSFKSKELGTDAGGMLGFDRPTSRKYVGIIDATFQTKVGVDLKKLRFGIQPDSNVVYVQGAHEVQNIGSKDLQLSEPFGEVRIEYSKTGTRKHAIEVLPANEELIDQKALHRSEVLSEVQNSALASSLAEANEKVALGFFKAIIGGGRFDFIAKPDAITQPLTFEQLCEEINGSIASQIEDLEERCRSQEVRALQLDDEILRTALEVRAGSSPTRLN